MKLATTFLSLLLTPLLVALPLQAEMAAVTSAAGAPAMETPGPGEAGPTSQSNTLQIRLANAAKSVVEASSSVKGYAILVTDASGLPVGDAAVAIRLPDEGATGFFADGAHSAVSYTNAAGVATFAQLNWASQPGSVSIRVTAVKGDLHAGALIEQNVVARSATALPGSTPAAGASVVIKPFPSETQPSSPQASNPVPGTPVSVASVQTGATPEKPEPVVSIVNSSGSKGSSHSTKKWILVAVVAAGAGVGVALAFSGKGAVAAAAPATAGISIGTPTLSVGH